MTQSERKKYIAIMEVQWRINFFVGFIRALNDGRFSTAASYQEWFNGEEL